MSKKNRARKKINQESPAAASRKTIVNQSSTRNWVLGLILGVTFLAFANTLFLDFAYDDKTQILQNETIRSFSNLPLAFTKEVWFWRVLQDKDPTKELKPTTPYYRPMFTLYLMASWTLFGDKPTGWHLFNIVMHLLAVYFAFLILERITKDLRLTTIATMLFAVHPLRAESVAWISGVTDLFLALFLFPSFYLYLLFREEGKQKHLIWSLVLFLLAAFSKEPAVALPIFITAYEMFLVPKERPLRERGIDALIFSVLFLLVSVLYFSLRYNALGFILSDNKYTNYPLANVLLTIPLVICKYLGLLFWPMNLSIFHSTPLVQSPLDIRFFLPLLAIAAIAFGLWQLRHSRISRFAILWFGINLLPVLNLSAFGVDFMVQERYVYIPSLGFSLLIAQAIVKLPIEKWITIGGRRTAQAALVALIVVLLSVRTVAQNGVWKDDMTLWTEGAQTAPEQTMPHYILAFEYLKQQKYDKAVEEFEKYMKLDPNNPVVMNNLAAGHLTLYEIEMATRPAQADRSHIERAIELCTKALSLRGDDAPLMDTLGKAYTFKDQYELALGWFDRGLRVQPDNPMIVFHKGATYLKLNQVDEAINLLESARRLQPDLPDIYEFLGYAYQSKRQPQEAIKNFNMFLQLQPNTQYRSRVEQIIKNLTAQLESANPKG
ncbi:MAG TPA: tetratricopeptide repeat protein [Blastocatellia bacterium]|nr:tetratricopeptide repeat protein [Blastocatellia bacterium]